jgi:hypothetical protein
VLDCEVTASVDMTFAMLWRTGETDTTIVQWTHHFDPVPNDFDAIPYEDTETSTVDVHPADGDQLIFRYSAANTTSTEAWIPNGDGSTSNGRIPYITPPW